MRLRSQRQGVTLEVRFTFDVFGATTFIEVSFLGSGFSRSYDFRMWVSRTMRNHKIDPDLDRILWLFQIDVWEYLWEKISFFINRRFELGFLFQKFEFFRKIDRQEVIKILKTRLWFLSFIVLLDFASNFIFWKARKETLFFQKVYKVI